MAGPRSIVVVGASLAGLRAVETLRKRGYAGRLTLIGAEDQLPYDRPPLSKEVLRGEWQPERARLTKPDTWEALALDLRLGRRAVKLDLAAREVELDRGDRVRFDGLVIATGAAPRTLPGTEALEGIHVLRSIDDALAIRTACEKGPRVLVVGAGFIGAEVAASCRARGLEVTMVEALAVPLGRVLPAEIGEAVAALHRDHGVDLRCGVGVQGFEGAGGRVERVRLSDGTSVAAELVVVGIGVVPQTDWLVGSGLPLEDGVVCDATCTAAPGIVAAGDVARWWNPLFDERMRVEHWMNASEQGPAAATALLDGAAAKPFANVPFFWSDQYDAKIQSAGRIRPGDDMRVAAGSLAERNFLALFGRDGRLTGALSFDRPRQLLRMRRRIAERIGIEAAVAELSATA
jgi:NADPH-dependent 2,4-dienoyl-CoA reductase/sulfur reductase-like enzyme